MNQKKFLEESPIKIPALINLAYQVLPSEKTENPTKESAAIIKGVYLSLINLFFTLAALQEDADLTKRITELTKRIKEKIPNVSLLIAENLEIQKPSYHKKNYKFLDEILAILAK